MKERLVILVPSDTDKGDPQYYQNFVDRVRMALDRDGLTYRLEVVSPPKEKS